jgi:hypothetical protein
MGGSVDTRAEEEPAPEGPSGSGRDPARRLALLEGWIRRQVDPPGRAWFRDALAAVARADDPRALARSVALVPRRLGKRDLVLTALDLQEADEVRPGFDPLGLPLDQAARIALLLASYRDPASFAQAIEALCRTADLGEFIAIYRGLALFPAPELLVGRAAEGVRSGIKPVFEAVAHRNPYPAEMFDRSTWNQMVLKALFIDSELAPIQRLDERANPELAAILVDYAHERWSAGRSVSPELWRCVGPFADQRALYDLEGVLETGTATERSAAALALSASNNPEARAVLGRYPDLEAEVISGRLDWASIGAKGPT